MRRWSFAAVAILLLAGAGWSALHSLGTCRPLDRLLGLSGCIGRGTFVGVDPLSSQAMSVPDEEGVASVFGRVMTADGWRAGMVRLDPVTGAEFGRHPVRMQNAFAYMQLAADGRRAMLSCRIESDCTESGNPAAIVSLEDASEIERLDDAPRAVPGDPAPGDDRHLVAVLADGGRTVVDLDDDDTLWLYRADGTPITRLSARGERLDSLLPRLAVSPGGRYVALLDRARGPGQGERFHVWDARDGRHVQTIETSAEYSTISGLAWSRDETELFALSRIAGGFNLDRFRLGTASRL